MSGIDDRDGRDDRIRKLFSRLPRMKAPEDFEERVARAVAGGAPRRRDAAAFARTLAIPGLALLLVGVISLLVFRSSPGPEGESGVPAADTADKVQTLRPDDAGVQKKLNAPDEPGPAPLPAAESMSKDARGASARSAAAPDARRKEEGARPVSKTRKTAPSLLMMEEVRADSGALDSVARRDSIARRDSLARRDSASSRDSLPRETPPAARDSVRPPDSRSKPE